MKKKTQIILEGLKKGDQIGGPFELSKILIESLEANDGFNKNNLVARYLRWWQEDGFDTGPTYASVFTKVLNGYKLEDAVFKTHQEFDKNTAGCGPAHRCTPLAGFEKIHTNQLVNIARKEAKITHFHEDAGYGSAIVVLICRYLLEGKNIELACKEISYNDNLKESWKKVENAKLSPDGYVFNVIHSALYFINNNKTLEESIKFSGKANYSSVLVGAFQACLNIN